MQKTPHQSGRSKPKRMLRVRPRFFLFIGVLLGLLSVFILPSVLRDGTADYAVRVGALGNPVELNAVIVRDEQVVTAKVFGAYDPVAREGSDVTAGQLVATVYDSGYSVERDHTDLQTVRKGIRDFQTDHLLREVNDPSLTQLSSDVDTAVDTWKAFVGGEASYSLFAKRDAVRAAISARQEYLFTALSASDENASLVEQYTREETLVDRLNSLRSDLMAPIAGRVSYFFDGLEDVLTSDSLVQLRAQDMKALLRGEGKTGTPLEARTDRPVFRIASPGVYYIVALFPQPDSSLAVGATVPMRIGGDEASVTGNVISIAAEGEEQVVVYRVDADVGGLIGGRIVPVSIGNRQEGLIVPERALIARNAAEGTASVRLQDGRQISVRVLLTERGEALIEPVEPGALVGGMKLSQGGAAGGI